MGEKSVVISVTKRGNSIGKEIRDLMNSLSYECDLLDSYHVKEMGFKTTVEVCFLEYDNLVFISSTGIAVRGINGLLKDKKSDPAVVVVDCTGKFVISLLSGHLGGANELTNIVAERINSIPVITTATDNLGRKAPDMIAKENGLIIDDMTICKEIAALIVNDKKVLFIDESGSIKTPAGYISLDHAKDEDAHFDGALIIGDVMENQGLIHRIPRDRVLKLLRRDIVLGIGCRRNFSKEDMLERVLDKLDTAGIDYRRVLKVSSIELKKDEEAIVNLSKVLQVPFDIFTKEEIQMVHHKFKGSDFVEKITGVRAVAEPVVELSGGEIILPKINLDGMTLAVGKVKNKF